MFAAWVEAARWHNYWKCTFHVRRTLTCRKWLRKNQEFGKPFEKSFLINTGATFRWCMFVTLSVSQSVCLACFKLATSNTVWEMRWIRFPLNQSNRTFFCVLICENYFSVSIYNQQWKFVVFVWVVKFLVMPKANRKWRFVQPWPKFLSMSVLNLVYRPTVCLLNANQVIMLQHFFFADISYSIWNVHIISVQLHNEKLLFLSMELAKIRHNVNFIQYLINKPKGALRK